jgi:hypothetical protein
MAPVRWRAFPTTEGGSKAAHDKGICSREFCAMTYFTVFDLQYLPP